MPKSDLMQINVCDNRIYLKRKQWNNREAKISNYQGLIEEVKKYTWTYTSGQHPYLRSTKLNVSLHKFVLSFLYGKEKVNAMLEKDNIIEHLDNDGLNCTYENLHIVSADLNKAKAFTIDKAQEGMLIPTYISDVYYSHQYARYQMQIFFNRDVYYIEQNKLPIEAFICLYNTFESLFIDWFYVMEQRTNGLFDISKFHADKILAKPRPIIQITEDEKDHCIIERDGEFYLKLETDDPKRFAFMEHTSFEEIKSNK